MENYFSPLLSEEQMAAYLDGMLTTEENNYIEEQIMYDPALQEIQDSLDDVDAELIAYDETQELPLECISDDFQLPVIDYDMMSDEDGGIIDSDNDTYSDDYYENDENDYLEDQANYDQDQAYSDSSFDNISF